MWAASPDRADALAGYAKARGISFPLLADDGLAVTRLYGVLDLSRRDLPYPTALVIDRSGTVRYRRQDVDFTRRPPASELLAAVRALPR